MGKHIIPIFKPWYEESMASVAIEVLSTGKIANGGFCREFEEQFGRSVEQENLLTVDNMTNAIQIALRVLGVKESDEVLSSPFACMSTNSAIVLSGATPVWVDVDPRTASFNIERFEHLITKKTKAAIVYHFAGYPSNIQEISSICEKNNIFLIEDCNNSVYARCNGKQVGKWGDAAIFSFYPNRLINAVEGGAIGFKNTAHKKRAARLRRFGINMETFRNSDGEINPEMDIEEIGFSSTMNNICSGIGLVQLKTAQTRLSVIKRIARNYQELLPSEMIFGPLAGTEPSYWVYLIESNEVKRLLKILKENNIGCSQLHYGNNHYTGFGVPYTVLPGCDELYRTILGLPCGWWMEKKDVEYIVDILLRNT